MKAAQAEARRVAATHGDTIAALKLAMPPALAAHFGSLARCTEASVVGARILCEAGIPARVVPCVARAQDDQAKLAVFTGQKRAVTRCRPDPNVGPAALELGRSPLPRAANGPGTPSTGGRGARGWAAGSRASACR